MNWKKEIKKENDEGYIAHLREEIELDLMYITKEESLEEILNLIMNLRGEE